MITPILSKQQYKEYERVSRYSLFPIYYNRLDEKYVYGLTAQLTKEGTSYVTHTVIKGDTLDSLSLYYFNSPLYFWIIATFNDILDPYEDLKEGTILKIPTFSSIKFDI